VPAIPRIGIDLMGCDTPPSELFSAALKFHKNLGTRAQLVVFATPDIVQSLSCPAHIECVTVESFITMDEDPLFALRRKQNSSIHRGMQMLQQGKLAAFVSAGNTGALIASAKISLPMLPGIARPALLTLIPTKHNKIAVLDVGANINFQASHLLEYAAMGIAYQKCRGIKRPTVGLLNIGSEAKKGTPELREAYKHLEQLNMYDTPDSARFIGNVEARDAFKGHIDVLVTDGFTGNVFLKTAEGIAAVILEQLKEKTHEHCSEQVKIVLESMSYSLHYTEYPGAILCGVEGIVVKCHGDATADTLYHGINGALGLVENSFLDKIKSQLSIESQKLTT
jgi:glycerol-3-phosphate acyltransferase PlsX